MTFTKPEVKFFKIRVIKVISENFVGMKIDFGVDNLTIIEYQKLVSSFILAE
jgi:hypothetical protein